MLFLLKYNALLVTCIDFFLEKFQNSTDTDWNENIPLLWNRICGTVITAEIMIYIKCFSIQCEILLHVYITVEPYVIRITAIYLCISSLIYITYSSPTRSLLYIIICSSQRYHLYRLFSKEFISPKLCINFACFSFAVFELTFFKVPLLVENRK